MRILPDLTRDTNAAVRDSMFRWKKGNHADCYLVR